MSDRINVTKLDMRKTSTAQLREVVKFVQMTRSFKVEGRDGVEIGEPGDYLLEYADGARGALGEKEFEVAYEVVHAQTTKEYLQKRGLES